MFMAIIMAQQISLGSEIIDVLPTYIEQQDLEMIDKWESQAKFNIYSIYYLITSFIGVPILGLLYKRKIKFLFPALFLCMLAIPLGIQLLIHLK